MKQKKPHRKKGFIALIASIMLSLILLGLTLRVSGASFSTRTNALTAEFKQTSNALARSCVQTALLRLREQYWYVATEAGDKVTILENTCTILEINHSVEDSTTHTKEVTLITEASFRGVHTTLQTKIQMTNPAFIGPSSPQVKLVSTTETYAE